MGERRTREQWATLVAAFGRSSQGAAAFCASRGLTLSTFRWWCSQLRPQEESTSGEEPVRLLAVDVARSFRAGSSPVVVIAFAGLEVRADAGTDVRYLAALVSELRAAC